MRYGQSTANDLSSSGHHYSMAASEDIRVSCSEPVLNGYCCCKVDVVYRQSASARWNVEFMVA